MRQRRNHFEKIIKSNDLEVNDERLFLFKFLKEHYELEYELHGKIDLSLFEYILNSRTYELTAIICYSVGISESTFRRCMKNINKAIVFVANKYNLLHIKKICDENWV